MSHDKLRDLAERATPGPWISSRDTGNCPTGEVDVLNPPNEAGDFPGIRTLLEMVEGSYADIDFIAAANPTTVLALLDEIEVLRKGRGRCKEDQ